LKDRVPVDANRKKFTLEGVSELATLADVILFLQAVFYGTVEYADNATEVGTPLNKANLLTDVTAALLGLGGDPSVDDALAKLYSIIQASIPIITFDDYYTTDALEHSTATALSTALSGPAVVTLDDYILFGGGLYNGSGSGVVNAYDTSLTRSTPAALSNGDTPGAARAGDYAVFTAGNWNATVYAYDNSLTQSTPTALSVGRKFIIGASAGSYAVFAGGYTSSSANSAVVDAYDSSLTRSTPTVLSAARRQGAGSTIESYALIAGGYGDSGVSDVVDAYDDSLTRSTPTALSAARYSLAAAATDDYALIGGGNTGNKSDVVDAYDTSLTRSTPTALSVARNGLAAAAISGLILFGGGTTGSNSAVVDVYDASLSRSTATNLNTARYSLAAGAIGRYVLFAGGETASDVSSAVVDTYTGYAADIDVPAFYAYKFTEHATEQFTRDGITYSVSSKANGYIKPAIKTLSGDYS